ncbi:MAG: hypothetical protein LBH39_07205, partial [Clostridiales Family XIII bacterium]|jgi:hypothetical protein|nr:hypothetical protein [Clostridiales Family XIII bacterium]
VLLGGVFAASRLFARSFAELAAGEAYPKAYIATLFTVCIDAAFSAVSEAHGEDGSFIYGNDLNISADVGKEYLDSMFSGVYGYADSSEIVHMLGQSAMDMSLRADLGGEFLKADADAGWRLGGEEQLRAAFALDDAVYCDIPELYPSVLALKYEFFGLAGPIRAADIPSPGLRTDWPISPLAILHSMYEHGGALRPMLKQMLDAAAGCLDFSLDKKAYVYADGESAPAHAAIAGFDGGNMPAACAAALNVILDREEYLAAVCGFLNDTGYYRALGGSLLQPDYLAGLLEDAAHDIGMAGGMDRFSGSFKVFIDRRNRPLGFSLLSGGAEISMGVIPGSRYELAVAGSHESFRVFGGLGSAIPAYSGTINYESRGVATELGEFSSLSFGKQRGLPSLSFELAFNGAGFAALATGLSAAGRKAMGGLSGNMVFAGSPLGTDVALSLVLAPGETIEASSSSSFGGMPPVSVDSGDIFSGSDIVYVDAKNPLSGLNVMLLLSGAANIVDGIEAAGYDLSPLISNYIGLLRRLF